MSVKTGINYTILLPGASTVLAHEYFDLQRPLPLATTTDIGGKGAVCDSNNISGSSLTRHATYRNSSCSCYTTYKFHVRADLAKAVVICCGRSWNFCLRMNEYINYRMMKKGWGKNSLCGNVCQRHIQRSILSADKYPAHILNGRFLSDVVLILHAKLYLNLDFAWDRRLEMLSFKWSLLKDAMAWLSTLGGGHSALGDYYLNHADTAGQLSKQQFKVALALGDKGLEYRCRLYYSLSLIQKGQLKKAKKYIRLIHRVACTSLRDEKLINMCLGVWSKLKFEYSRNRGLH